MFAFSPFLLLLLRTSPQLVSSPLSIFITHNHWHHFIHHYHHHEPHIPHTPAPPHHHITTRHHHHHYTQPSHVTLPAPPLSAPASPPSHLTRRGTKHVAHNKMREMVQSCCPSLPPSLARDAKTTSLGGGERARARDGEKKKHALTQRSRRRSKRSRRSTRRSLARVSQHVHNILSRQSLFTSAPRSILLHIIVYTTP